MNPTDYAWSTVQSITQKTAKEIKVIVDDSDYPSLERDDVGYVLHLGGPKRVRENLLSLHGAFFDNDQAGKSTLWRLYRASVYHLCIHAATTDFTVYRNLPRAIDANNALFAVSLAEDFALRGCMRVRWPGLILDTAYANYLSALRFKDLTREEDLATKVAANLLSFSAVGRPLVGIGRGLDPKIESLHASLVDFSHEVATLIGTRGASNLPALAKLKLGAANAIADLFEKGNLYLSSAHTLPYADSHGDNYLFESSVITSGTEQRQDTLKDAFNELSISLSDQKIRENEKAVEAEGGSMLGDWEYSLIARQRLVDLHKELDPHTHFENFAFPAEDYAEFIRTRSKLVGPIGRVLEQLRMLKSSTDEVTGKESGYVDIPAAIQVVASESDRTDVFIREETETKSEAWAILLDASKSLEAVAGEVKQIAVCLAEVADDMIPNPNSWACYAFNENLYVIKDFSELYGSSSKGRIGGLPTGVKTYLPDAIRIAAKRLQRASEDVKVLLVASDGFPLGYDGIDGELVKSIEQVMNGGTQLVGLGVGSSLICNHFRSNCVVNSPFDLMKHFVKTYYELASTF